jgi:hypothetical protein
MLYFLFTIDQEAKKPLPFKIELFKYYPTENPIYYVIHIDKSKIEIYDSNNKIYMQGTLNTQVPNNSEILYNLLGVVAGGTLIIKGNNAELILNGSGLPFIDSYKGTLKKLIKK